MTAAEVLAEPDVSQGGRMVEELKLSVDEAEADFLFES
jgi:hypothetical protein